MPLARLSPLIPFTGLAVLASAADQMSKLWALSALEEGVALSLAPFLALTLGFNTGVSFGVFSETGQNAQMIVVAMTASVTALLIWYAVRAPETERLGLSLIVGGAIGNLIDRFARGKVTDFIDVHVNGWHWPAFNLADTLITLGIVCILVVNFKPARLRAAGD